MGLMKRCKICKRIIEEQYQYCYQCNPNLSPFKKQNIEGKEQWKLVKEAKTP
jgi:hypothetical protein